MFKVAIEHYIIEKALDILLNRMSSNFIINTLNTDQLQPNQHISELHIHNDHASAIMYDVIILWVDANFIRVSCKSAKFTLYQTDEVHLKQYINGSEPVSVLFTEIDLIIS